LDIHSYMSHFGEVFPQSRSATMNYGLQCLKGVCNTWQGKLNIRQQYYNSPVSFHKIKFTSLLQ